MNTNEITIFSNIQVIASNIIEDLQNLSVKYQKQSKQFNIVLPGGHTPRKIYQMLAQKSIQNKIPWRIIHFYWGDERCVHPDHSASNFGMAYNYLLKHIPIPEDNIHRIHGENNPEIEIIKYAEIINSNVEKRIQTIPQFDWILLGVGRDGHTASLFPDNKIIKEESGICAYTMDAVDGYRRITLTYKIINRAARVTFLVIGSSKADILKKIFQKDSAKLIYPAARINPRKGNLQWYLDSSAAGKLNFISPD
jgi:6-phosphogluconolactonase